jgi:hypothetical protein
LEHIQLQHALGVADRTEDDVAAASYEAEAEVSTDGPACGLVSHRPQTPKPKPKRKLTGAQRKKVKKAKKRGGGGQASRGDGQASSEPSRRLPSAWWSSWQCA